MLSHISDVRVRLIPVDTNHKGPSWVSDTPNCFKNLSVYDIICVYDMCVFECMDMGVQVPQHVCGSLRSTLGVHFCLPPCLRQFYFAATYSRLSGHSPLVIFLSPSPLSPQECWDYQHVQLCLLSL